MYDYLFYKFYARGDSQEYVLDKGKSIAAYKGYMINRLMKMFHYEGLPETIPSYMLEYYLMVNGSCVIAKKDDNLYAFLGSFGGEPDPYYRPTLYVVANPALKFNKTFSLWDTKAQESDQCVFMRNDVMWMGLNPLMSRYATLLAENVITLRTADILLRVVALLTAPDDKTRVAAEQYLKNLEDGKLSVVGENRFFDGVKLQSPPSNNGSYLTQFIELQQYYKGSFFNEIGLAASFNMKREAIGEGEAALNDDTLTPLIETMLECRKEDVSRLNEMFGLNITVEFDSAWKHNIEETKLEMRVMEAEANMKGGDVNDGDGSYDKSYEDQDREDSGVDEGEEGDGETGRQNEEQEPDESGSDADLDFDASDEPVDTVIDVDVNIEINDPSQLTEEEEVNDNESSED